MNRMTREDRLEHLRAMRAYLDAPPGQGVEPKSPTAFTQKMTNLPIKMKASIRPEGGISDAAAQLIALALKDMLRS